MDLRDIELIIQKPMDFDVRHFESFLGCLFFPSKKNLFLFILIHLFDHLHSNFTVLDIGLF